MTIPVTVQVFPCSQQDRDAGNTEEVNLGDSYATDSDSDTDSDSTNTDIDTDSDTDTDSDSDSDSDTAYNTVSDEECRSVYVMGFYMAEENPPLPTDQDVFIEERPPMVFYVRWNN